MILAASSLIDKFGELEKFIKKDGIKIYKKIFTVIAGDKPVTMAKTTALEISELEKMFLKIQDLIMFLLLQIDLKH